MYQCKTLSCEVYTASEELCAMGSVNSRSDAMIITACGLNVCVGLDKYVICCHHCEK